MGQLISGKTWENSLGCSSTTLRRALNEGVTSSSDGSLRDVIGNLCASARLPCANPWRFHNKRLPVQVRRKAAGSKTALLHPGYTTKGCQRQSPQRGVDPAWHGWIRKAVSYPKLWRRCLWTRAASGREQIFHYSARQHRARRFQQAE